MTSSVVRPTVAARMNRLPIGRTHKLATVAVGLGLFFDIYEVFLAGVLASVLVQEFHLSKAQTPILLSSTFVGMFGMFVGALVLGRLADRVGRRRAFLLNLGIYSVFSLLGAFSFTPIMLVVLRFCAGIGIGAEPPLADTYLSDLLPARRRGRFIAWAYTISFLGVPAAGFFFGSLVGAVAPVRHRRVADHVRLRCVGRGDRLFPASIVAGIAAVAGVRRAYEGGRGGRRAVRVAGAIAGQSLDEPAAEQPPSPAGTRIGTLFFRPPYGKRTGMMMIFHILQTLGYYGFGTLVPLVLAAKGYPIVQSLLFSAVSFLGYPIGSLLSLPLVERVERKFLVTFSVLGMGALGLAFGYSGSTALVLVFGFLYTCVSNIFSNSYHIYQAEIFPTALRSTAASGTYALSRLTSAAMPFVLVPVLNSAGAGVMFAVVATAMVLVSLTVGILGPRTTGRPLEAVNAVTA
ncbi:MFS transporter [Fodinicola feengrottensis]|uniref:MFS transporter n=1 Tax=Fodinicola feengrottensis TaxID=435914 RepID=UPI00244301FE|nr:MFS transporter [Fodinicola feengrottensis]